MLKPFLVFCVQLLTGLVIWFGIPSADFAAEAGDSILYIPLLALSGFFGGILTPKKFVLMGLAPILSQIVAFTAQFLTGALQGPFGPIGYVAFVWFAPFPIAGAALGAWINWPKEKRAVPIGPMLAVAAILVFPGNARAQIIA